MDLNKLFNPESVLFVDNFNTTFSSKRLLSNLSKSGFSGRLSLYNKGKGESQIQIGNIFFQVEDKLDNNPIDLAVVSRLSQIDHCLADELAERDCHLVMTPGQCPATKSNYLRYLRLSQELIQKGIYLLGPQSSGVFSNSQLGIGNHQPQENLPSTGISALVEGESAFNALLSETGKRGFGLEKVVDVGEQWGISLPALLRFLAQDEKTRVIVLVLSSIADGTSFKQVAYEIAGTKPVICLLQGGSKASHNLFRNFRRTTPIIDKVMMALCRQCGFLFIENFGQILQLLSYINVFDLKLPWDSTVFAVANDAYASAYMADKAAKIQLRLLSPVLQETAERLSGRENLTADMIQDLAQKYLPLPTDKFRGEKLDNLLRLGMSNTDTWATVAYLPAKSSSNSRLVNKLCKLNEKSKKPLILCGAYGGNQNAKVASQNQVVGYPDLEEAFMTFKNCYQLNSLLREQKKEKFQDAPPARQSSSYILDIHLKQGLTTLDKFTSNVLLAEYGIPVCDEAIAFKLDQLKNIAGTFGYPVALMVIHDADKSRAIFEPIKGIKNVLELEEAYLFLREKYNFQMGKKKQLIFLVQKMVDSELEFFISASRRPYRNLFGPFITFGLGGAMGHVYNDITAGIAPLTINHARNMIYNLSARKLFSGFRDLPQINIETLAGILVKVSVLFQENPNILEMDINPLVYHRERLVALESFIFLRNE